MRAARRDSWCTTEGAGNATIACRGKGTIGAFLQGNRDGLLDILAADATLLRKR
jgi:hypothetical protein